jgi:pyruvate dehydrogenase E2 component (dihydrolipoamide acetyltransferase)
MAHAKQTASPDDFILPDLGEGVHEAELIRWRVEMGQQVAEHDILAEMETDKALVEVPSPRAGTIAKLHGEPGEILKVGSPLVSYVPAGASAPGSKKRGEGARAPAPGREEEPGSEEGSSNGAAGAEDAGTVVGTMTGSMPGVSGKVLATPAVRRLARDLGVDLARVAGSGIGGRILERDVRAAAEGGVPPGVDAPAPARTAPAPARSAPAPAARKDAPAPSGEAREAARIPFRGVRRTIAGRLRESVDRAVHFTVMDDVDATDLDGLRRRLSAASGEKVSFLPFVASAVCRALAGEFASLNSTVDEADEEQAAIVRHKAVHLGIATDTESGLMVPVIRDADRLGVLQIAREVERVAASARNRTIAREALVGSTFTISNVGSHAGRFATPVINYPEVGILAVGRAREGVVAQGGWFRVGQLLPLSLACDHRVVDGATAARCLARIVELLRSPEALLEPARG